MTFNYNDTIATLSLEIFCTNFLKELYFKIQILISLRWARVIWSNFLFLVSTALTFLFL